MKNNSGYAGVYLRWKIRSVLQEQGFVVSDDRIELPESCTKNTIRELNHIAVKHNREKSKTGLIRHEERLIQSIANGSEVNPDLIKPKLITVSPNSEEELLFRYTRLHWSIPVSAGYGRRLRFLIKDESNGKLIGIIGLCDPVYSLKAREKWIGWNDQQKKERLYHLMDAFVLGAVPPYNQLLFGKFLAMLITAKEIQDAFCNRYAGNRSLISGKKHKPLLALISTTSALGKSSVYSRLKIDDRRFMQSVGFTKGSGDFQFCNGIYKDLSNFVRKNCKPSAKHNDWGSGFRNRREIIRKGLQEIGLPSNFRYHNINREIFLAPLAHNAREFLCGETDTLDYYNLTADDIYAIFKNRWLVQRAKTQTCYKTFLNQNYKLWENK